MVGFMAYSLAGHDKNKIYVIIKEESNYVWLADGEHHKMSSPKRKNRKHIQVINNQIYDDKEYGNNNNVMTDETVKRAIKLYCKDIQEVK